jgi:hypothetical protein
VELNRRRLVLHVRADATPMQKDEVLECRYRRQVRQALPTSASEVGSAPRRLELLVAKCVSWRIQNQSLGSDHSGTPKGEIPHAGRVVLNGADDHVVDQLDVHEFGGIAQLAGHKVVRLAGSRIPARVIVRDHDG